MSAVGSGGGGRNPGRGWFAKLFYEVHWTLARLVFALVYRLKIEGAEHIPASGPVLLVPNHQSNFDPILAGMPFRVRHVNFIAKSELGSGALFRWFYGMLNCVFIRQGQADLGAIRAAIEQLGMGRVLLVFPEGTRTRDGSMHTFKRGVWLILNKAKCPVLPVAIEGAYDAFPRGTSFPKLIGHRLRVRVGAPIPADTLLAMGDAAGLEHLRAAIDTMRGELADAMARDGFPVTTRSRVNTEAD